MAGVALSTFNNNWYDPGRSPIVRSLWFFIGLPLLRCSVNPSSRIRASLLRLFGAKIGRGVVLKPGVRVKYPWRLTIGDHTWIGEDCWIDNLGQVNIGANCCVSQGVYLCTGNHDWSDPAFGLLVTTIEIEDGAWVGAKAVVGPGCTIGANAVVIAGSVITKAVPPDEIHGGNPARFLKHRVLRTEAPEVQLR